MLYYIPILLNGEEYNLQVAYDFSDETWLILGAAPGLDEESGMAAKELRLLAEGDVINTIWQRGSFSGDDDFEMYAAAGSYAYSDAVIFDCADGEILTTVIRD